MNPSDLKKKKAIEHIVYEIMMFNATSIKLRSNIQDPFEINILLESFAIHCRNLFDFFYKKTRYKDDLLANDYLIKKRKFIIDRTNKRKLENLTNKANKQIAHLTYSRNNYNRTTKGWSVLEITQNMNVTIVAFFDNLDSKRKKLFRDWYQKYDPNGLYFSF